MKVLILEDEFHAANRLKRLLESNIEHLEILDTLDSVEEAKAFFENDNSLDLIFADIQLADGLSFSVFQDLDIQVPVIFTTAFDQYTLKAFKLNSIDYLLKPIDEDELVIALTKFRKLSNTTASESSSSLVKVLNSIQSQKSFKERFLIRNKDQYIFLLSEEIAYFYSEDSVTFIVTTSGKSHIYDYTLNNIEKELDPSLFHRINRKQIVSLNAIQKIHTYFNNRVKLDIHPTSELEFVVSREKVKDFKRWLGG